MLENAAGPLIFPLGAFSVLGLMRLPRWSWQMAVLLALAIPTLALVYKSPAALARYVYILLPGLVILAAYALSGLLQELRSNKRTYYIAPLIGITVMVLLGTAFLMSAHDEVKKTQALTTSRRQHELNRIANIVDDGKAVLGSRAGQLVPYLRDNKLVTAKSVTQDEFVTYLSWRSTRAVRKLFIRHNVGWVLIRKPPGRWEVNYHVWLRDVTGELPRHHFKLQNSKK